MSLLGRGETIRGGPTQVGEKKVFKVFKEVEFNNISSILQYNNHS